MKLTVYLEGVTFEVDNVVSVKAKETDSEWRNLVVKTTDTNEQELVFYYDTFILEEE